MVMRLMHIDQLDILYKSFQIKNSSGVTGVKRSFSQKVVCHKLVLKSVSYPKIVKNTPILIEQSIACNVYT